MIERLRIDIPGIVQGVGFRPWVFRGARTHSISGFVRNTPRGVLIEAQGAPRSLEDFQAAVAARADRVAWTVASLPVVEGETTFAILESTESAAADPVLSPDVAMCDACARELSDPQDRRFQYPFIACARCGPRQSVTHRLPFDRAATSWASFPMCPECRREYEDPNDRRFHAQTISCPRCGPELRFLVDGGRELATGAEAIALAAQRIRAGEIVAVKGVGGFHLMADAASDAAVARLRERKARERKPFALMVGSELQARRIARWSDAELHALRAPANPIVLVCRNADATVSHVVAPGLRRLGVMLAATGLHRMLLGAVGGPVVATSGNVGDEPICTDEAEAAERLARIADCFLVHPLRIQFRLDDSIVHVVDGEAVCLRRSRGYPLTVEIARDRAAPTILAAGGDLKNAIALSHGASTILGPHQGTLGSVLSLASYERSLVELPAFFSATAHTTVADLHPEYRSAILAEGLGRAHVAVQHHCAHLAAVACEHGVTDEAALGVAWDGTGYGPDGTSWGGEFFFFSKQHIERIAHLRPFALIGGDLAATQPRRVAWVLARDAGLSLDEQLRILAGVVTDEEHRVWARVAAASPHSSSMGRLFDGIAALLGIRPRAQYEGQAAMELQSLAESCAEPVADDDELLFDEVGTHCDWAPLVRSIVRSRLEGVGEARLSLRFHRQLCALILHKAERARAAFGIRAVLLAGGVFQNVLLLETVVRLLRANGFVPRWNRRIPPNDGGLAIGQISCASVYQDALKSFHNRTAKTSCAKAS
jgi:hydrogenase maturation protein HypF